MERATNNYDQINQEHNNIISSFILILNCIFGSFFHGIWYSGYWINIYTAY